MTQQNFGRPAGRPLASSHAQLRNDLTRQKLDGARCLCPAPRQWDHMADLEAELNVLVSCCIAVCTDMYSYSVP